MKFLQFKDKQGNKKYASPYWPVGSIYLSVSNTNPTKWFGGTWEQIAKGRTLVGVDPNDNDFNTVKKIGGEKNHRLTINEIPQHRHLTGNSAGVGNKHEWGIPSELNTNMGEFYTNYEGGDQVHNNLQPYFTCYIWQRTA